MLARRTEWKGGVSVADLAITHIIDIFVLAALNLQTDESFSD